MTEETSSPSGDTHATASGTQETEVQTTTETTVSDSKKDFVAYDSHRKLLSEKKALASKYEEMSKEFQAIKEEKLEAEGKKDELISTYRKKLTDLETEKKTMLGNYAYKIVSSAVKAEAAKLGCIDTDALIKLSNLDELEVSDDFEVNSEQVKGMIESIRKEKHYLFDKTPPKVVDGKPVAGNLKPTLNEKSPEELARMLAAMDNRK